MWLQISQDTTLLIADITSPPLGGGFATSRNSCAWILAQLSTGGHNTILGHTFVPALEKLELYHMSFRFTHKYLNDEFMSEKALSDVPSTRKHPPRLIVT